MKQEDVKLNIIFVDDDEVILTLMAKSLEGTVHKVRTASSGKEALELMKKKPADLLVTDIRMPEMGGLELMEICRKEYPRTMIIVVTVEDTVDITEECLKRGAIYCLQKPIDIKTMRKAVSVAVDKIFLREKLGNVDEIFKEKEAELKKNFYIKEKSFDIKKGIVSDDFFQFSPVPLAVIDYETGDIKLVNKYFTQITELEVKELLSKNFYNIGVMEKEQFELFLKKVRQSREVNGMSLSFTGKKEQKNNVKVNTCNVKTGEGSFIICALV